MSDDQDAQTGKGGVLMFGEDNVVPRKSGFDPEQGIGRKLIEENIITEEQLEEALLRQRSNGGRVGDNLIDLGYLTEEQLAAFFQKKPSVPKTIQDTGLDPSFLADLALKHILFMREFRLLDLCEKMKLSMGIVDAVVEQLQREKFVEVKGASELARFSYRFGITGLGQNRASELLEICSYAGPAPVTLEDYRKRTLAQTIRSTVVHQATLTKAFSHLIINPQLVKRLGPAMTSGRSIFLYGPPGNGKTSIAEAIGNVLPETIYIPHTVYVGGQLISVYDPLNHFPVNQEMEDEAYDKRWLLIKRPVIITGGELTLKTLDLEFNAISKFYVAPLQMKANNGLFIIDDFGRQQIEPKALLNRWIVPLERRVDFMTLHTGMKFEIPFDQLVIFSTNLEPRNLVDEAFLRRIRYKIKIDFPSESEFEAIFRQFCAVKGVIFNKEVFQFLKDHYYRRLGIQPSANHPRDLLDHIIDQSRYFRHPPELNIEGIKDAWESYFVEL
ncbi:MAG: putative ATPase protein [Deltaproteobacteria bacterium]|nr:putative ATPase protein [Deltaproteobacteria bacterium]